METFLIIGLGNPGKDYAYTRHNIGFRILENWLTNLNIIIPDCPCKLVNNKKQYAKIAKIKTPKQTILLAEPQTYMNNSGAAVKQFPITTTFLLKIF